MIIYLNFFLLKKKRQKKFSISFLWLEKKNCCLGSKLKMKNNKRKQIANNKTANKKTANNKTSNNKTSNNKTSNNKTSNNKTANNETANNKISNNKTSNNKSNVPKKWRNNLALYHWKQQTAIEDENIEAAKIKHKYAMDKFHLLLNDHQAQIKLHEETSKILIYTHAKEAQELTDKHAKETQILEHQAKAMADQHSLATKPVYGIYAQSKIDFEDAKKIGKIAQNRCKDPIFKNMAKLFPLVILNLLVEYNSYFICQTCSGYFLQKTECLRTRGHAYKCKLNPVFVLNKFSWPNNDDQAIFEEFFEALKSNPRAVSQCTENFVENQKAFGGMPVSIIVGNNFNSLSVCVRGVRNRFLFKISNVFAKKMQVDGLIT